MSVWERAWDPDAEAPTSLWGSLLQSGFGVVYALEIEGIPFIFAERELYTIRGVAASLRNSDDLTMSYGLMLESGARISQDCNREDGLASGRAVEFTIGRQQIADEAVGAEVFVRPTVRANLTTSITLVSDDVFEVDNCSSFAASGFFYLGRECVRYEAKDGSTKFIGCVRGVAGQPHYHASTAASGYRQCTDKPVFWRGRLVTLWAHLVGPDGRFIGERWAELGAYCRQEWRGYIRDTPRPDAAGVVVTCLPLVRLAAQEFGAELQGTMVTDTDGLPWIVAEPGDQVYVGNPSLSGVYTPLRPVSTNSGIMSIRTWAAIAENQLYAYESTWEPQFEVKRAGLIVKIRETEATAATVHGPQTIVESSAWFLENGQFSPLRADPQQGGVGGPGGYEFSVRWSWDEGRGPTMLGWIVIRLEESQDYTDAVIPSTGLLVLEGDEHREVAAYDKTFTNAAGDKRAFRISARHLMMATDNAISSWHPWANDTTVRVISGVEGGWSRCLMTLMTSSGTGDRGDYDTLGYGFGIGVPESWIGIGETGASDDPSPAMGPYLTAATTGKTSVRDILCGWLALMQKCLVQRRTPSGEVVLDVCDTSISPETQDEVELYSSDVLMEGHETPETIDAPNYIRITASDALNERPHSIVRDVARAQAEGVHSLDVKAPNITAETALRLGGDLLTLGDGQAAVRMRLGPWVSVQIGDSVRLATSHPALYDWQTGTFAPSSAIGRVVGHEVSLYDQSQAVTVLLAAQAQERVYLCPCARVEERVSGTVWRVEKGGAVGFAIGDLVRFYTPGNETAYVDNIELLDIDEGETYDVFTVASDPGISPVYAYGTREIVITFPHYDYCTTRQRRFAFHNGNGDWA